MVSMSSDSDTGSQETQPSFPNLPRHNDPRWQQVIVHPRRQRTTDLRSRPHPRVSQVVMTIHSGDIINVVSEIRFETWIAAKVGDRLGWLNTWYVGIELRDATQPVRPVSAHDWMESTTEPSIPKELLVSQMESTLREVEQIEDRLSTQEVNRIVRYLKGIKDTLRSSRQQG